MALGKKCRGVSTPRRGGAAPAAGCGGEEERLGLGIVRLASFGRKRIVVVSNDGGCDFDSNPKTPLKKLCARTDFSLDRNSSPLEALPKDVLIRVVCGVDHVDLKPLSTVSKAIREATMIAKDWHFAYSTPKKIRAIRDAVDFDQNSVETDEIEAPNAPRQPRPSKSRVFGKKLDSIAVNLFN